MSRESLPLGRGCSVTETGEYLKEAMEGDWWGLGKGERRGADLRYTRRGAHDQVSWLASSSEKGRKPVIYGKEDEATPNAGSGLYMQRIGCSTQQQPFIHVGPSSDLHTCPQ